MAQRSRLDRPKHLGRSRRHRARFPDELLEELQWERLLADIARCVAPFAPAVSSGKASELFVRKATDISKLERQVMCLDSELENWLVLHQLTHKTAVYREETPVERQARLQQFWQEFHQFSRRGESEREAVGQRISLFPRPDSQGALAGDWAVWAEPRLAEEARAFAEDGPRPHAALAPRPRPHSTPSCPSLQRPLDSGRLPRLEKRVGHKEAVRAHGRLEGLGIRSRLGAAEDEELAPPARPSLRGGGDKSSSTPSLSRPRPTSQGNLARSERSSRQRSSAGRPGISPRRRAACMEKIPQIERSVRLQERVGPKPPAQETFPTPWGPEDDKRTRGNFPVRRYVKECQHSGIVLGLQPFVTGHSEMLRLGNHGLVDTDLAAITAVVPGVPLRDVDLGGNLLLSDRALEAFLSAVMATQPPALARLSLHRCVGIGQHTLGRLTGLLNGPQQCAKLLRHLDLGGVTINMRFYLPLCVALREHGAITNLCLAATGLGEISDSLSMQSITELLASPGLDKLDLGWSCFSREVFTHLGRRLSENRTLRSLLVGNCSSAASLGEASSPVMFFLELLGGCSSLTKLDLSLNRMGYQGGLILEDQLEKHENLRDLIVSHNPLGVLGMRHLFRLLMRPTSKLKVLTYDKCSQRASGDTGRSNLLSASRPGGKFTFNFSRPYDRALLRMLYKACERLGLNPEAAFTNISATPPYHHPASSVNGAWEVPSSGRLCARFSLVNARQGVLRVVPEHDFDGFLREHFKVVRLQLSFEKVIPIMATFKMNAAKVQEQIALLDVLSRDFSTSYPSIRLLCTGQEIAADVLERLLPTMEGGREVAYLTQLVVPSINTHLRLRARMQAFFGFNPENPTGHYRLDLGCASDFAVAERLLLLDRWEAGAEERRGLVDVSSRGMRSHLRDETYQQDTLDVDCISDWFMPEHGFFEFDYVSGRRPPPGAGALSEGQFRHVMHELQRQALRPAQRVRALRTVAHKLYLKAAQVRELLTICGQKQDCADVVVMLFFRLVDPENEKICRVYFDDPQDVFKIWNRLGSLPCFPFVQPEQTEFEFHFHRRDHRLAANLLFNLADKEGTSNLKDIRFVLPNGKVDPLERGVPRTWSSVDRIPTGGIFSVRYGSSPEDRKIEFRSRMANTYGYWQMDTDEDRVQWCANLHDCPKDLFSFVDFLRWHYATFQDAFLAIVGKGNAFISMSQFEIGMERIQCERFAGPDENQRIRDLFRYIDGNMNGKVSLKEFVSLDQFVRELTLIVQVFMQVLGVRTGDSSLQEAWRLLDPEGAGCVLEEHWRARCAAAGYRGPARPVFNFLDWRMRGHVARADFLLLELVLQELPEEYRERGGPYSLLPAGGRHPRAPGGGRRRACSL